MAEPGTEEVDMSGPLEERLVSKNWRTRLASYEELHKLFVQAEDEKAPIFREHAGAFKTIIADSNAAAQAKGLEALIVFLERAECAKQYTDVIIPALIEKGLSSQKATTKAKASDALLFCIEAEPAEPVIAALLKAGSTHKVPKVRLACLATVKDAIKAFGVRALPFKLILKQLPSFFNDSDSGVRGEATAIAIELCRWLGHEIMTSHLSELRSAQVTELQKAFEAVPRDPPPIPTRYLRSQAPKPGDTLAAPGGAGTASGGAARAAAVESTRIDPYDLAEPVNILGKIGESFYEGLNSAKWKDRKEQLDALVAMAATPRLEIGDYSELCKALKKCLADANVLVVALAAQCLGLLARGLRGTFTPHARTALPVLLDKLKERKATVLTALHDTLDTFNSFCFSPADVWDDITAAAAGKVPAARAELIGGWLVRSLTAPLPNQTRAALGRGYHKALANLLLAHIDDGNPAVRDACYRCFGTLVAVAGDKQLAPFLAKLDGIKEKKVRENVPTPEGGAATALSTMATPTTANPPPQTQPLPASDVDERPRPTGLPKLAKAPSNGSLPRPAPAEDDDSETAKPPPAKPAGSVKSGPARTAAKPAGSSAKSANTAHAASEKAKAKSKAETAANPADPIDMSTLMGAEEALALAAEMIPPSIRANLEHAQWKERVIGLEELMALIDKEDLERPHFVEAVMRQLEHKPGWASEKMFQVTLKLLEVVARLSRSSQFTPALFGLIADFAADKLADAKLKRNAEAVLTSAAEAVGPAVVVAAVGRGIAEKNPKTQAESLLWIAKTLEEFGIDDTGISLKFLLDSVAKPMLTSSTAAVRSAATRLLVAIVRFAGVAVVDKALTDVKPALKTTIDAEIGKVAGMPPPAPTRRARVSVRGLRGADAPTAAAAASEPRADISSKLTAKLMADMNDAKWSVRVAALEMVAKLLHDHHGRIQPKVGELWVQLKKRLTDSHAKVVATAISLLGNLAAAIGKPAEKQLKAIVPTALACFNDNKKAVRDAVATALDQYVEAVGGLEPFLAVIPASLVDNVAGRRDLLTWLIKHLAAVPAGVDMRPLIPPVLTCLMSKTPDVRHPAEVAMKELIARMGYEAVARATQDLKKADLLLIVPVLEGLRSAVAMAATAPSATTTASSTLAAAASTGANTAISPSTLPTVSTASLAVADVDNEPPVAMAATAPAPLSTAAPTPQPPLLSNSEKEARGRADSLLPWRPPLSDAHIAQLEDQLRVCVGRALHDRMSRALLPNAAGAVAVATTTVDELVGLAQSGKYDREIVESLDVLMKWGTAVLWYATGGNVDIVDTVFRYFQALLLVAEMYGYRFTEYEAGLLLPALLRYHGNNAAMKTSVFRTLYKVHSPSKVFPALYDFVSTAFVDGPAPAVATALEEVAFIIRRFGANPNGAVSTPRLVSAVCSIALAGTIVDESVREAAMGVLRELYGHLQDELYALAGPANREALARRLAAAAGAAPASAAPATAVSTLTSAPTAFKLDLEKIAGASATAAPLTAGAMSTLPTLNSTALPFTQPTPRLSTATRTVDGTAAVLSALLHNVATATVAGRIEGWLSTLRTAELDSFVVAATQITDALKSDEEEFVPHVDRIFGALGERVRGVLGLDRPNALSTPATLSAAQMRLLKYALNALLAIATRPNLARVASAAALEPLMSTLFDGLLVPVVVAPVSTSTSADDVSNLRKAVNHLIFKLLDNTDRYATFSVLLGLLGNFQEFSAKFTELVIKCLMRQTKLLRESSADSVGKLVGGFDLTALLRDIHLFLVRHPPASFVATTSGTAASNTKSDLPLKAVRTVLYELVQWQGEKIREHLLLVVAPSSALAPPAAIRYYIDSFLKAAVKPAGASSANGGAVAADTAHPLAPTVEHVVAEANKENSAMAAIAAQFSSQYAGKTPQSILTEIFRKIVSKESSQGVNELYYFLRVAYPKVDVGPHLKKTSESFQAYIRRSLDAIAKQCGEPPLVLPLSGSGDAAPTNSVGPSVPADTTVVAADATSTVPSTAATAAQFRDKLREWQAKYGLIGSTPTGSSSESTEADSTLQSTLASKLAALSTQPAPAVSAPAVLLNVAPAPAPVSVDSGNALASVEALRARLERIKKSAGV